MSRHKVAFLAAVIGMSFSPFLTGCGTAQAKPADAPTAAQGATGPAGPAGPPGIVYRNAYNPTVQYSANDAVTYQRSTYIALASSVNIPPVGSAQSAAKWSLLAAAGVDGSPGAAGSAGPIGPQGVPGVQGPTGPTGPLGLQGQAGQDRTSFLSGKRFYVLGDSISAVNGSAKEWQKIVAQRTGMVPTYTDAIPGRKLSQAFVCYGANAPGDALGPYSTTVRPECTSDGGKDGATLADNLADSDMAIIELGTNDESEPVGHSGDAPTAGTVEGTLRWIVEAIEAAKPSIRVVIVTPQYNSLASAAAVKLVADGEVEYAESVGAPAVDMFRLGGVNAMNLSTLTKDGIHPTQWAFDNLYGPVIAQHLMQIF